MPYCDLDYLKKDNKFEEIPEKKLPLFLFKKKKSTHRLMKSSELEDDRYISVDKSLNRNETSKGNNMKKLKIKAEK